MKALCCFIILTLTIGLVGQLHAQEELPVGTRSMGMSGAFIAIADDASAVMWNPAGMTQLSQQELTTMWTNLFNSGVIQSYLGYVLPITNKLATGVDWTAIQFKDGELAYSKNRVHLAGAYRPIDWLSCGINIKYLFSSTKLDDISEGDTRRVDGDIGILLRPLFLAENLDKIKLAFVLRDVANTGVTHEYQSEISYEEISARKGVIGLAYETPLPNLVISAETDVQLNDRLRIGGEYQFGNLPVGIQAALRAGLHKYWDTGERPSFSVGGSLGVPVTDYAKVLLEYAYLDSPVLSGTHRVALRIPFDFNPTAVDIIGFDYPMPLFASLYRRYANQPVVNVVLYNKQDKTIKLQISLAVKGYTPKEGVTTREDLLFDVGNLRDPASLAAKLRDAKDPLSQYLREKFSEETQRILDRYDGSSSPSEALRNALVDELNRLLQSGFLYDEQRFAQVKLKEETRRLIEQKPQGEDLVRLNWRLLAEAYPHEIQKEQKQMAKREQKLFSSLPIVLSDKILEAPQGEIPITVEVTYPEELRFKPARKTFSISLFPKGKVPSNTPEGVKPYVAFITHEDQPVTEFARKIVEQYDKPEEVNRILAPDRMEGVRGDLSRFFMAMQIYESLRSYGVYYRPDANEAYNEITKFATGKEGYFADSVRYPREFLLSDDLGGDCDDWSVLYASLLESRGIATALVDVPGHVFVMFNTGIPPHIEAVLGLTVEKYIIWKDTLWDKTIWIPIDPPQRLAGSQEIDDSFYAAWESGLQQCRTHNIAQNLEKENRIVSVREVQDKEYPPASLTKELEEEPSDLSPEQWGKVDSYLTDALARFYSTWEGYVARKKESPIQWNYNGIAAAHRGNFKEAKQQFQKAIDQDVTFAPAYNNLGNLFFSEGNFDDAIKNYEQAREYTSDDEGIQLNLALAYLAKRDFQRADLLFKELHRKLGTDEVCWRLGIPKKRKGKGKSSLAFVDKLYQILGQIEEKQHLNVELDPDDVRGMSTGFYWKRQTTSAE